MIVIFLLYMLTSIQFDDEFLFDADEIGNVISNSVLSSETDSQLIVTEERP